jgi:hypothetical protein
MSTMTSADAVGSCLRYNHTQATSFIILCYGLFYKTELIITIYNFLILLTVIYTSAIRMQ